MKKIILLSGFVVFTFLLAGCQKKPTTQAPSNTGTTQTGNASEALPQEALSSTTSSRITPAGSETNSDQPRDFREIDSFIEEKTQIDETFKQNYQIALEDAQRALKGGAKYCGTIIKFYGAQLFPQNIQAFLFYNDDFSKDYYWQVELNGYNENKKTRSFIARRDIASNIKCSTDPAAALSIFSNYYERFSKTEKFKLIDPGIIAETKLFPMDSGFNIVVIDNAGTVTTSEVINSLATTSTNSSIAPSIQKSPTTIVEPEEELQM